MPAWPQIDKANAAYQEAHSAWRMEYEAALREWEDSKVGWPAIQIYVLV